MMFITIINSHTPTWHTIAYASVFYRWIICNLFTRFPFSRTKFQVTIFKRNDDRRNHVQHTIEKSNKKNFGRKGSTFWNYKEQTMSNNKQTDFPVQYSRFIAIKYFRGAALAREIVNIFVGRFSQLKYFERKDIQQQRSRKERIEHVFSSSQADNCHCAKQRKKSVCCSQKETTICSPAIRLILSKKCSHNIPVLSAVSITLLKPIQKLFYVKNLELSCLFLQKHGAFLLGKEAKSFMFLGFFEAIPYLTHRICAKP